ncbi:TonB-dependent siderophore receptor [Rhizobium laguerreae]|uniref:TonB-dependent siderophore receptor n=2 Tax=Rhizobium laguerreae TaxID=1076926 RepID=A0AB35FCQ0_9HYPH|nr:TonB-dependent siderophore receptor [Rhizobium laguerreae]MBY3064331.1 TonB-dependent siderophore receptor [Rhizobium laguerreae]MBY3088112.1 TonB-dependent siderophore receptor [Rhizobium laguerreae]MBY3148951.1 TonB-dependent siderophore receptor [Rhizobium laguerreae]MBY3257290.1 TonB-dependent siderophore receptor [Rhizobium laguerreae]MBY3278091.1 TonB-dependent siderophore receptor [Rhizobium laguerreae]
MAYVFLNVSNNLPTIYRETLFATTAILLIGVAVPPAFAQTASADANATALEPIVIQGAASDSKTDRTSVTAKNSAGATKISTPLVETPRSISVTTEKEIEQRGAQTVIEAVRYSAGVTTGTSGFDPRFDQIYIRGYNATTVGDYRDGLRQPYINYGTFRTEPYQLQRVEVIKGPVSVLYGSGSPGGLVNKISKLPTEEPIREVGISYGTEDRVQGMFDFGGPISEDNEDFLYRIVGVARRGDTNFDIADDRYLLAPSFTWRPDEGTSFTVYGLAQADETDSNVGAITTSDGRILDIRASDPDYDYQKVKQQQVGYQFEHEFDNGLTFRQNLRYSHLDLRARYLGVSSWTGTVAHRGTNAIRDEMNVFQVDNQLEAKFDTGPLAHTMLFGLDYTNLQSSFGYGAGAADPAFDFDIANPTYGVSGATPDYNVLASDADMRQVGIYVMDQIEVGNWRFNLGGRQTWVNQTRDATLPTVSSEEVDKNAFSVQAGALYLFDNGIAPFVSYATSFDPVTNRSATNTILPPTKGEQYEVGVKYQPPGSDILLSAVAYHIVEQNKPRLADPLTFAYDSQGEVTGKGIELEARAAIADGLDIIAAYTYNDSEVTGGNNVGNTPAITPTHIASLWANYTFQESNPFNGLSVGAGVRYIGETWTDVANTSKNPATFYVDASASYDLGAVDKKYEGLTAAFNIRNIADERETVCEEGFCYLGQGRNMTGTLKYRW